MLKREKKKSFFCIISGGQTGADQAALDAAIDSGLDHGGWVPKGRKTEAGPLPSRYQLQEHSSGQYRVRTESNVVSADGTLICSFGPLSGGSALTEALAIRHNRPFLHINFDHTPPAQAVALVEQWIKLHAIVTLNVAGPRASNDARIYRAVYELLTAVSWPSIQSPK